jgi:transcriptional regulator with XRE-family HTH domain
MSTKEETRKRIGQRVRILRTQAGLTQQELADRAGLQRTHIGRIEDGAFGSQVETIQQVAEALGMTVDIIDPGLQDLAPLKRLTPPIKGALCEALESKVTETFKAGD